MHTWFINKKKKTVYKCMCLSYIVDFKITVFVWLSSFSHEHLIPLHTVNNLNFYHIRVGLHKKFVVRDSIRVLFEKVRKKFDLK